MRRALRLEDFDLKEDAHCKPPQLREDPDFKRVALGLFLPAKTYGPVIEAFMVQTKARNVLRAEDLTTINAIIDEVIKDRKTAPDNFDGSDAVSHVWAKFSLWINRDSVTQAA